MRFKCHEVKLLIIEQECNLKCKWKKMRINTRKKNDYNYMEKYIAQINK